ncbi:hypothetical protein DFH27DRAFT_327411 [Peziza echinospora]|nr:hypothetical protein DFH27DRAFT_327411 [Peziza echinospora]
MEFSTPLRKRTKQLSFDGEVEDDVHSEKDSAQLTAEDDPDTDPEQGSPKLRLEKKTNHTLSTPSRNAASASTLSNTATTYPGSSKRQRIQNASAAMSTLSKPFRSPLIVRRPAGGSTPRAAPMPSIPPPPRFTPAGTANKRGAATQRTSGLTPLSRNPTDPEITALSVHVTQLRNRLKAAQTHLATSEQALALESLPHTHKDSDEHLEEVIMKWRGAARQAADYLFGVAGDRVNMMGGARAYFERERERKSNWDDNDNGNASGCGWGDGNNSGEEDLEAREERKRQLMAEYDIEPPEEKQTGKQHVDMARTNDDSFTMDMMLKTMNIDLDLIGFDTDRQCWKD